MRVLFAITTGRHIFRSTIDMLAYNLARFGQHQRHHIGLMVSYDPSYRGLQEADFLYAHSGDVFAETLHVGPLDIPRYQALLRNHGLSEQMSRTLLQAVGYGQKKNIAVLEALHRGYDLVLFWDDDEYPVVCCQDEGGLSWIHTDVLSAHMGDNLAAIDVGFGFTSGYDSPVMPGIETILSRETAYLLGEAFTLGTEFITPDFFVKPEQTFLLPSSVPPYADIQSCNGGKWVTGGNLSFRISSIRAGKIPPYYTPKDSRGDDTILSMQLHAACVVRVPSGTFHDCFLKHTKITQGIYPETFVNQSVSGEQYLKRFAAAIQGWIAYGPLMIRIRDGDQAHSTIRQMSDLLWQVDQRLPIEFPDLVAQIRGGSLSSLFEEYTACVDAQYDELQLANVAWQALCSRI
jgi:hypothetical protein